MSICSFEGCLRPEYRGKNWCHAHYRQSMRGGEDNMREIRSNRYEPGLCIFEGCLKIKQGRDYCPGHKAQLRRYGSESKLKPLQKSRSKADTVCKVPDCPNNTHSSGYCNKHHKWYVRGIKPQGKRNPILDHCSVLGCKESIYSNMMCESHNTLNKKHKITNIQISQLLVIADFRCQICEQEGELYLDHNRNCCRQQYGCGNCVRGFLCPTCNFGLGHFQDSETNLAKALEYLNRDLSAYLKIHDDNIAEGISKSRRYKYGIGNNKWDYLVERAGANCEICSLKKHTSIDHCHSSGDVRGLLCSGCNSGLGCFHDNESLILSAIKYLEHGRMNT